jgi:hypothetical protein
MWRLDRIDDADEQSIWHYDDGEMQMYCVVGVMKYTYDDDHDDELSHMMESTC